MCESFDVFLSHNSKDKPTVRQLAQALQARGLKVWLDEEQLVPGRRWQDALEEIIQTTHTAAVLVGEDGLGPWEIPEMRASLSEFVDRQLPVIPVLLPDAPTKPEKLPLFLRAFTWVDLRSGLTDEGLDQLQWGITGVKPKPPTGPEEHQTYYLNLPNTGRHFIGRDDYLKNLDKLWNDGEIKILVIKAAFGGEGKSALVNEWLKEILPDPGNREVEGLYGCTFHSQGVKDTGGVASSDFFIEDALGKFGDPDPTKGSLIEKANRLANLVRKKRTLLILDSLEPLQSPYGPGDEWRLKDPAMRELLNQLATNNKGLCIITTRAEVIELRHFLHGTVEEWKLPNLSVDSGVELLKRLGVKGTDYDLENVVIYFSAHALTLTLLGNYLDKAPHGDVRLCHEIGLYEVNELQCELRSKVASDGNAEDGIIRQFKMEFESKKKDCAVLIVCTESHPEKWTLAGFDDAGEFRTVVIDGSNDDLSKELKKEPRNERRIVELATSSLGCTHQKMYKFQRIMLAYENWLGDKLLAILYLLGFFEYKVDMKALEELKKARIQRLTDTIPSETSDLEFCNI